ncbi:DHHW family protein [Clostridiaceae bacterium HSG29]|nr:DHHW family protein [Clostridiaceae bacterium HSG29]
MKSFFEFNRNKIIAIMFIVIIFVISIVTFEKIGMKIISSTNDKITEQTSADLNVDRVNISTESNLVFNKLDSIFRRLQMTKVIIEKIEQVFFNNIFLRGEFAGIDANLMFFLTKDIRSRQVLLGEDNWLFYKSETDGNSISDFQGVNYLAHNEMENIKKNLLETNSKLKNKGIQFVVMIPPNKELVYADKMPDSIKKIKEKNRTDVLVSYLKNNTDITIIYPKQELCQLSKDYQLYYKYDTHWNQLGAYIAEQQLLHFLGKERDYLERQFISEHDLIQHESASNGLANMIKMKWYFNNAKEYLVDKSTAIDNYGDTFYFNNDATYKKKILFIGDSFRIALIPHLTSDFSDVYVIHRKNYNNELFENINPDIIVLEYVERYSGQLSDFKMLD